jgi:DNA-binding GntR family transcriptional regulator
MQSSEETLRVTPVAAPVREQVLQNMRRVIVEGRFQPGERLVERELCELTGVSRTSIREMLRQLEAEGLVVNIPNKGVVVASLTAADAQAIYEVRAALEGLAGQLFAERASEAQIDTLAARLGAIEALQGAADQRALVQAKDEFYQALLQGAGNPIIQTMLRSIHNRVALLRAVTLAHPGRLAESIAELRQIVTAIQRRNAGAAWQACVTHVLNAAAIATATLRQSNESQEGRTQ